MITSIQKKNTVFFNLQKIFILVILFLTGNLLQAQDTLSQINPNGYNKFFYDDGTLASEGGMINGKPEGYWKNYFPNGKIKSEGNRKDFLLDSIWKFYDEEGELTLEIQYQAGKKNGYRNTYQGNEITKEYFVNDIKEGFSYVLYADGSTRLKIPFVKGLEEGISKEFDPSGNIIELVTYKKGYIVERERINRYDNDSLPNGKWKWFYDNDQLKMEGTFKNGLKNGYFKEYDLNGNLISAKKFVNGELQEEAPELVKLDIRTDYYPDGKVKIVGTYTKEGIPEGVRREYNEKGNVEKAYIFKKGKIVGEGIFTDAGQKEGNWKEYYPDGKLKGIGEYSKDNRIGLWKFYFNSGQLEQVGAYKNGVPDSLWTWYHANSTIKRTENYYNGLQDGMTVEYDSEGKIISQGEYIEGKKDGLWIYNSGDSREEGKYSDDLRNGTWKVFYQDGTLQFEGKFVDDLPNGKHVWYWDNGKIKQEGEYVMGRKSGDWKKYDEQGLLIIEISFRGGREVKYDGVDIEKADLDDEE
jgi:antitoxin component YwqK of YwqJK toxin-antitoxin module